MDGSGDCKRSDIINTAIYFIVGDDHLSNLVLAVLRSPQFTNFMDLNHYILHITFADSRGALAFQETFGHGLPPMMYVFAPRGILIRTMELARPMIRSLAFDEGTAFPMLTATIQDIVIGNLENVLPGDDADRPNASESSDDSDHSSYGGPLWNAQFNLVNAPLVGAPLVGAPLVGAPLVGAHLSPFTILFRHMRLLLEIVAPPLTRMYEAIVSFFPNLNRTPAPLLQEQDASVQQQEAVQEQDASVQVQEAVQEQDASVQVQEAVQEPEAVQVEEAVQVQEAVQEQDASVQVQEAVQEPEAVQVEEAVQVQEAEQEQEAVQVQEDVQEQVAEQQEDDAVQEPRAPAVWRRRNIFTLP